MDMLVDENRRLKSLLETKGAENEEMREQTETLKTLEEETQEENEVLKYKVMSLEAEVSMEAGIDVSDLKLVN